MNACLDFPKQDIIVYKAEGEYKLVIGEIMKPIQLKLIAVTISMLFIGTVFVYYLNSENEKELNLNNNISAYDLLNFGSYEEYNSFLQNSSNYNSPSIGFRFDQTGTSLVVPNSEEMDKSVGSGESNDYSSTNIQELGVDEPDIVKTDGKYLYVIANSTIFIINAYPAEEAAIITSISLNETQTPRNLFIKDDRLVIITQTYLYRSYAEDYDDIILKDDEINQEGKDEAEEDSFTDYLSEYWVDTTTTEIIIYDVSTKANPTRVRDIQMKGYYSSARLIDEYIYVITSYNDYEPVLYDEGDSIYIPKIRIDGTDRDIGLSHIYYIDSPEISKTQTQITSVNILNQTEQTNSEVFILGNPSIVYVSLDAIYITNEYYNYNYAFLEEIVDDYILPSLPSELEDEIELVDALSLEDYQKSTVIEWLIYHYINELNDDDKKEIARQIVSQYERTTIHKIEIENGQMSYAAQGSIPGSINNQFSMSEYNGTFRVATTVNGWMLRSYVSSIDTYNNVYVLDESLNIIGSIEDIAVGESIYSVRFMDTICYLVTYKEIDPFFVIDLEDPTNPTILGELKIPGYSTYLHPYDENHIIGIGMEDNTVKISLFDVEDVSNPVALDTYEFEAPNEYYWMYSSSLYEHKAFLFDKAKNLLVLPVSTDYIESAYVFTITSSNIKLRGIISHLDTPLGEDNISTIEPYESSYWKGDYRYSITRSLYIEDVIYTFSDAMIQMNDMSTLNEINSLNLI